MVVETIPFGRYTNLPSDALACKIFVTASNYYPGRDGEVELSGRTQSKLVAAHLSGSRVVKAFNTVYYQRLAENGRPGSPLEERETIFVAGDDSEAVAVVSGLIEEIGFAPVATGTLAESVRQEPGSGVYNPAATPREARAKLVDL